MESQVRTLNVLCGLFFKYNRINRIKPQPLIIVVIGLYSILLCSYREIRGSRRIGNHKNHGLYGKCLLSSKWRWRTQVISRSWAVSCAVSFSSQCVDGMDPRSVFHEYADWPTKTWTAGLSMLNGTMISGKMARWPCGLMAWHSQACWRYLILNTPQQTMLLGSSHLSWSVNSR